MMGIGLMLCLLLVSNVPQRMEMMMAATRKVPTFSPQIAPSHLAEAPKKFLTRNYTYDQLKVWHATRWFGP